MVKSQHGKTSRRSRRSQDSDKPELRKELEGGKLKLPTSPEETVFQAMQDQIFGIRRLPIEEEVTFDVVNDHYFVKVGGCKFVIAHDLADLLLGIAKLVREEIWPHLERAMKEEK